MKVVPCDGPFGVEILDLDINRITAGEVAQCQQHLQDQGVIFFRNQLLDCDQHIAFAKRFGDIVINRFFETVAGYPQIAMVRKEAAHQSVVGEDWHTDHSYDQQPALGSILYALEVPATGGETLFINMHQVFESLSGGLQNTLQQLRAVHSSRHAFGAYSVSAADERFNNASLATQDSTHPMVITHPLSGRKVLYVNADFTTHIDGWSEAESRPLLEYLYQRAGQQQNILCFNWEKGSLAFWDNRATWHKALNNYPGQRRLMHRITLAGSDLH